jgi:aminopeptidase YwaD
MTQRTKQILILVLLVFVMATSAACDAKGEKSQVNDTTVATEADTAVDTAFVPEFSEARMLDTIKLLSSKDNARITGFEGELSAADYLTEQYTSLGLEVSAQTFPVKAYVCNKLELKVTSDADRIVGEAKALSYGAATPAGGITADVVPLGMGADSDYVGKEVKGKVVLMQRGGEFFFVKTARAAQKGAVAVLFYDPNSEGAISATLTELSKIPAVSINRAEGQGLEKTVQDGNVVTVSLNAEVTHEDSTSKNIIALYKSTDNPEGKRVIVGAHYDGVDTPAANDNASGAAVILEMAKALTDQKIALPYDIAFVSFGAEEIGLVGSEQYVYNLSREEKDSVIAMLNFDMVGVGDTFDIGSADGFTAPDLIKMTRETLEDMGYTPTTSVTDRSDHAPFAQAGINAVYVQVGPFHDYHTDLDTIEVIQPEMLTKVCELGTKLIVEKLPEVILAQQ